MVATVSETSPDPAGGASARPVPTPEHAASAIGYLEVEHRQIRELLSTLPRGAGADRSGRQLVDELVKAVSRHLFIEEQVLYPKVAEVVELGPGRAERRLREHRRLKRQLARLQRHPRPGSVWFGLSVRQLSRRLEAHERAEETETFPALHARVGDAELAAMADRLGGARTLAPTRPHRWAPQRPPANRLVGPLLGLWDRLTDLVSRH
ncbi:MAG: hemerythrin domain-containing protein [Acidimicrobiales bacterium]|nr:hemerythrin domain-containing protein [Acidimicrobiales bacterium]